MKGGILQVLVVSAKGIRHTSHIVKPAYYILIECGTQVRRSKTSKGFGIGGKRHDQIYWNEKFTFELPISESHKLKNLKFTIMDEDHLCSFRDGKFVGETMVYVEGIIKEGNEQGFIQVTPTPYNVLLQDDTYKGEIKIGLRFTPNTDIDPAERRELVEEQEEKKSICYKALMNLWKMSWWQFSHFCRNLDNDAKHKGT